MNEQMDSMEILAARVGAGDRGARNEFRERIDPHLDRIVRRALAKGDPSSSMVRKIAAAARRLGGDARSPGEVAALVAANLSQAVLNRLTHATEQVSLPAPTIA